MNLWRVGRRAGSLQVLGIKIAFPVSEVEVAHGVIGSIHTHGGGGVGLGSTGFFFVSGLGSNAPHRDVARMGTLADGQSKLVCRGAGR